MLRDCMAFYWRIQERDSMQSRQPVRTIGERKGVTAGPRAHEKLAYLIHDMQSAVTSVSLMVELLELAARTGDDSTQRSRAESAQISCRHMASLCTEAARVIDGTIDEGPVPEEFDLLALLVEAMTVYSPLYELAGKTLKLVIKCRSAQLFGIRAQLFRAVSNLLENGLKHTSNGASVNVSCSEIEQHILVSISDGGPGIDELVTGTAVPIDSLPVVVDRLSVGTGVLASGTGLRFVSAVVALNGGSSTIERNLDGGTTVTLKFMKHKNEQFRSE